MTDHEIRNPKYQIRNKSEYRSFTQDEVGNWKLWVWHFVFRACFVLRDSYFEFARQPVNVRYAANINNNTNVELMTSHLFQLDLDSTR